MKEKHTLEDHQIDITGIDRAELLTALHNGTKSIGLGVLHDRGDITVEQVQSDIDDNNGSFNFDYYRGRPIKVFVRRSEPNILCRIDLYDRDSAPGRCKAIVESLRG